MFVLDTDITTLLFAGHPRVLSRRDLVSSADIPITVVSRIQSLQGRFQFLLKAGAAQPRTRRGWKNSCPAGKEPATGQGTGATVPPAQSVAFRLPDAGTHLPSGSAAHSPVMRRGLALTLR
jgi:hypothetical protein